MAVPKRKTSKARRDKRRANHGHTPLPAVACERCGAPKLSHRACASCGAYRNRTYPVARQ